MHPQTRIIGLWCNGNTSDSGPDIPGSSPGSPTKKCKNQMIFALFCWFFFLDKIKTGFIAISNETCFFYSFRSVKESAYASSFIDSSITLIFCCTNSKSAFSLSTLRLISVSRLLPFLDEEVRKPRLFS